MNNKTKSQGLLKDSLSAQDMKNIKGGGMAASQVRLLIITSRKKKKK